MNNPDIPKWEVIGGKQTVIICAEKRPAYEHKRDWEKAFRREVQDAMRMLMVCLNLQNNISKRAFCSTER